MNKKASVADAITVPAFILLTVATTIVCLFIWFSFQSAMTTVVADSPSNSTIVETMNSLRASYTSIDYMIPILVGGLMLVSLIFAFKTGASVVYALVSLFFWAFAMLMSAVYSNVYEVFKNTFPSVITEMPIMDYIMTNMKWVVLVWLVLISIVMFTRNKQEESQLGTVGVEQVFQ